MWVGVDVWVGVQLCVSAVCVFQYVSVWVCFGMCSLLFGFVGECLPVYFSVSVPVCQCVFLVCVGMYVKVCMPVLCVSMGMSVCVLVYVSLCVSVWVCLCVERF